MKRRGGEGGEVGRGREERRGREETQGEGGRRGGHGEGGEEEGGGEKGRRRGAEGGETITPHSPELCGAVVPELEGDPHGSHGGVLYQGHTSQTRHQHVLLQRCSG